MSPSLQQKGFQTEIQVWNCFLTWKDVCPRSFPPRQDGLQCLSPCPFLVTLQHQVEPFPLVPSAKGAMQWDSQTSPREGSHGEDAEYSSLQLCVLIPHACHVPSCCSGAGVSLLQNKGWLHPSDHFLATCGMIKLLRLLKMGPSIGQMFLLSILCPLLFVWRCAQGPGLCFSVDKEG